jgi:hypothetical protein
MICCMAVLGTPSSTHVTLTAKCIGDCADKCAQNWGPESIFLGGPSGNSQFVGEPNQCWLSLKAPKPALYGGLGFARASRLRLNETPIKDANFYRPVLSLDARRMGCHRLAPSSSYSSYSFGAGRWRGTTRQSLR